MSEASIEELKELASLIRNGRLFDVQAWLESGKPFRATVRPRVNPILESVRTGFHSMVEVFLTAGLTPAERNELLSEAVGARREDMVELLIEHGADDKCGTANVSY
jgi:hypothetical protein